MKSVIIIGDGMSDRPVDRLGGRTPLEAAKKPNIDRIARQGRVGLFRTIPEGMPEGSDVANLSVLGYDPKAIYQGRAVFEAASMGVELDPLDVAMRCNLVTVENGVMVDHSSGHLSTEEGAELIGAIDLELGRCSGDRPVEFCSGISYRHLLVLRRGWASQEIDCSPPHDHVGENVADLLPRASSKSAEATVERLLELYRRALPILEKHPINAARRSAGKRLATSIWPWSPGRKPGMKTMEELFGLRGAVISAVDLVLGLGRYAGLKPIHVPGATGLWDTNYEGKASACLDALEEFDFVYVHVEATDEAGHARDLDLKVRCIEMLDSRLVGPILQGLEDRSIEASVSVLPDHPTPVETGKHADDPVPVAILRPDLDPDRIEFFDEKNAALGSLGELRGDAFIRLALGIV